MRRPALIAAAIRGSAVRDSVAARARHVDASRAPAIRLGFLAAALAALCALVIFPSAAFAAAPPTVTANPAEDIGVTTIKLSGAVNPHGGAGSPSTSWRIEYTPEGAGTWSLANQGQIEPPASEEGSDVGVEAIFGYGGELHPGQSYEFRIVAERGAELAETAAPYPTFTMHPATAPALTAKPVTEVRYTTAVLGGELDPEGGNEDPIGAEVLPIRWALQYTVAGEANWQTGAEGTIGAPEAAESNPIALQAELPTGALQPAKQYEERLLAFYASPAAPLQAESPGTDPSFETEAVAKPTVTIEAVSGSPGETVHLIGHVNPNSPQPEASTDAAEAGAFRTEWHFQCEPSCGGVLNGELSADDTAHTVEAEATKLEPHQTYTVKLLAANTGGTEQAAAAPFSTEPAPPTLTQVGNTPLHEEDAVGLGAYLKPRNSAVTDCRFEWGATESYGESAPCTEGEYAPLGPLADNSAHLVKAHLTGLTPGTTYHARLKVSTAQGGTETTADDEVPVPAAESAEPCPNEARRTEQHSTFLPDCRAYEMVSPADKNGANVIADSQRTRAATDGDALAFDALGAFADAHGTSISTEYIAERSTDPEPGDSGWSTHAITPPQKPNSSTIPWTGATGYEGDFSPDLSRGVLADLTPQTDDPFVAEVANLYRREDLLAPGAGSYSLLSGCPRCEEPGGEPLPAPDPNLPSVSHYYDVPLLAWASPDLSHLAFESHFSLTADTPASPGCDPSNFAVTEVKRCRVHVYESAGSTPRLVGRVPVLPEIECNDAAGPACTPADVSEAGAGTGLSRTLTNNLTPHVVSDGSDGHTRVFFTQPTDSEGHTSEEAGNPESIDRSLNGRLFMREDGHRTVEIDASERTSCSVELGGSPPCTPAPAPFAPSAYLDASRDGERAFFISAAPLTDDATVGGPKLYMWSAAPDAAGNHLTLLSAPHQEVRGTLGVSDDGSYVYYAAADNIYLWHKGRLTRVATAPVGNVLSEDRSFEANYVISVNQARVTPDGHHLLFSTTEGTGVLAPHGAPRDFDQGTCTSGLGVGCRELYLYDATDNRLQCVSCNRSGSAMLEGKSDEFTMSTDVVWKNGAAAATNWHHNRAVSASGRYVFFSTAEPLVPEDTNGTVDAYEYDTRTGEPHLLSSGTSEKPSWFLEASPDGRNAFFATAQPLSKWDIDTSYDVYDARVEGGFPEPPPVTAPCNGDSCRSGSPPTPTAPPTGSAGFRGPGNSKPKPRRHRKKHHKRRHHRKQRGGASKQSLRGEAQGASKSGSLRPKRSRGPVRSDSSVPRAKPTNLYSNSNGRAGR